MTSLDDVRAAAADLADQRATLAREAASGAADADTAERDAHAAAAIGDDAAHLASVDAAAVAREQRREVLAGVSALDEQFAQLIAALDIDPCDAESDVPLVLLPVRLETRYTDDLSALRVRIYPDDVHVDRLDAGVSAEERTAGLAYWSAVWTGEDGGEPVTENGAWSTLQTVVHPARAPWVAVSLTPTNLADRPDPPAPLPVPNFPDTTPGPQQAPVARGLPDRFVVVVVQGDARASAVGSAVPPEVVVGLSPDADPATIIQHGRVVLGPGMQWMVDPDAAAAIGLLVEVPLPKPGDPVDRVLAFGVRGSLAPAAGAAELTRLLGAHRFATGAGFVAQGTPTNNTETDRADWTARPAPTPPSTRVQPAADGESDAARLATALGVDPALLAPLPGGDRPGQSLTQSLHTALWQPTWGTFLRRLVTIGPDGPSLADETRERWRDWWQERVRGSGPLPTLRVGDQPYGFLPVSGAQSSWIPDRGDRFEPPLLGVLRAARSSFVAGLENVPRIDDAVALDDTLLEVLGSAPHLLGLRVRSIASDTLVEYANAFLGFAINNEIVQTLLNRTIWAALGFGDVVGLTGSLGATTRPLGLPLVSETDREFIERLLRDDPREVGSVLQALLELAWAEENKAVNDLASREQFGQLLDRGSQFAGELAPRIREAADAVFADAVRPEELYELADRVTEEYGPCGPGTLAALQPIEAVRTDLVGLLAIDGMPSDDLVGRLAVAGLGAWLRAHARLMEVRSALERIVGSDVDERAIAVAQALDCASHRYDAWATALPSARVDNLRAGGAAGTMLGAFGWVEGLAPGEVTTRPGGYVLAPSLTHAATAGVLRSAYLTHNPDAGGSGALAIDLSSARVRVAVDLLDGLRQGQPMGALLGYRIERRMHEEGLDRFVLSLRALAPTVATRLTDRADAVPQQAKESLTATDVVDGVRLLDLFAKGTDIAASLVDPPADNPYLAPGDWIPITGGETAALHAILESTASHYDAASDLLLAESVHQLVQGNTARAAATLDAVSGGDAPPVDPEFVTTPIRAAALTHRIVVLLPSSMPGAGGWSATTPRALAAPQLTAWAEQRLGPATDVVVQVDAGGDLVTLDAIGLAAIDVVATAGDPAVLERQLRAALPALGAAPLVPTRDEAWPAGLHAIGELAVLAASLGRLVAAAQPLTPESLARASDAPKKPADRTRVVDITGLDARVDAAVDGLKNATDDLGAALALEPPDDAAVADAVDRLVPYGISLPAGGRPAAEAAFAEAARRVEAAEELVARDPDVAPVVFDGSRAFEVGEIVFGIGFRLLAPVAPVAADLYGSAYAKVKPGASRIRRWLRDVASVRAGAARFAETLLLGEGLRGFGATPPLHIAQLAVSGTAGGNAWLGLPLPDHMSAPDTPVTSMVIEAPVGYAAADPVAGLVVDSWAEQLPRREADGNVRVTAGLAVNANAPGARAPQTVLVAVSPDGSRWTTDGLAAVLQETLELAKIRAVTFERSVWLGRILPALQEQSWSLQGEETIDIETMVKLLGSAKHMLAYVQEVGP